MARRKTGDKKLAGKKNRATSGEESIHHVQADDHSIAFEEIHVGGDVGGDIRIGHTIGYTAEQVSVLLTQITSTLEPKKFDGRCPYKGLEVFEEEDAELFFGRERLVNELVGRVKESRTVFITGPSGSGKSSLVRAGLIHTLRKGAIKSSEHWLYETMKPGREPLKDLALAFSRLKSPELQDYFLAHMSETDILNKCAESVLSGRKDQRFVLFIDQFEEIFTQISGEEERVAFLNMLSHAGTVENGRVIVLFAMRSDFVSNCATYPLLNEMLSQQFRQIGAMQPEELVSAIALPAMHVGLPIENELIAEIIRDMKGEPDALPLMQFALKDLFDAQMAEGGVIALTLKDYLKHGGIHKSLERHADATFAQLSESEQELARSIFSGLIEIGRGTQDTKRTALFDELIPANTRPEEVGFIIQKLADARLIITDEQAGKDTVTISHEKLIEAWPWLKKLVNENRDAIAMQNEIASDAKEWEDHKRDVSYLYSGVRLANVREQLEAKKLILSETSHEFVKAGQAQERRNQRTRIIGVAIPIGLVIAAVILFSYIFSANSAKLAEERLVAVNTQAALVSTSQAVAVTAQAAAEAARKQTDIALARQLAAQAQSIYAKEDAERQTAVLLAIRSMQLFPTDVATQILHDNNLARPRMLIGPGATMSIAFSPDGKHIASGSGETVLIWEVDTGKEVARILHNWTVTSVFFSPDGKYVVLGSFDSAVRVLEARTGKEVVHMQHEGQVNSVAFSPDGEYVVSGGGASVQVWDATTGKEVALLKHWPALLGDTAGVQSVAFSSDGKYIVSSGEDSTVVWDLKTRTAMARQAHDYYVHSAAISPDGKFIATGHADDTARVWDIRTGEEIASMNHNSLHGGFGVKSIAFSPHGKYILTGAEDGTARLWELATGEEVARMTHDGAVTSVAISPDGKTIVTGSEDSTIRMWIPKFDKADSRFTYGSILDSVVFSPDGNYLAAGMETRTSVVWKIATSEEVLTTSHATLIWPVTFSPDSKYVVSSGLDHSARVWEASTGRQIARLVHDDEVSSVAFSPDGNHVITGSADMTARLWEASTGKEIARLNHEESVSSVAFSPDGKYVITGSGGTIHVWKAKTEIETTKIQPGDTINFIAFSLDSKSILSISGRGQTHVWNAETGEEKVGKIWNSGIFAAALSPDAKYIAGVGLSDRLFLWDTTTGQDKLNLIIPGDGIHMISTISTAFSPNGKYLVTGGYDKTARVWEVATGREFLQILHDHAVGVVNFSPDGKYVVTVDCDEMDDSTCTKSIIRLWIWQPEDLIADACSRVTRNLTRTEWERYIGDAALYEAICPKLPIEAESTPTAAPVP